MPQQLPEGWKFKWCRDDDPSPIKRGAKRVLICDLLDQNNKLVCSLSDIDDPTEDYKREVESRLLQQALEEKN